MTIKVIFKITYPNGKIYIGKDLTNDMNYFGSANGKLIEQDFTENERRNFFITKEIIWESSNATNRQVHEKEMELIVKFESNNPAIGYNRIPKYRRKPQN